MKYQKLGRSEVEISRVGLGCMSLSGVYGAMDRAEAGNVIARALDSGINFFDTADVYGAGGNETMVGEALRNVRQRVVIATKGGATRDAQGVSTNDGSPRHLKAACDTSLKRLGIDTIDLYYPHRVDPHVDVEESVGALADLVHAGKVRYIGLSEAKADTLRRAHAVHPVSALQTEYALSCRFAEQEILATCLSLGVTFVAYAPLGRGLLSGGLSPDTVLPSNDARAAIPRFSSENLASNLHATQRLQALPDAYGVTIAQLALAWAIRREPVVAIPGSRSPARVANNAAAADLVFPEAVWQELDHLFPEDVVHGERHSAHMLSRTNL